jgi:hypothetical protein
MSSTSSPSQHTYSSVCIKSVATDIGLPLSYASTAARITQARSRLALSSLSHFCTLLLSASNAKTGALSVLYRPYRVHAPTIRNARSRARPTAGSRAICRMHCGRSAGSTLALASCYHVATSAPGDLVFGGLQDVPHVPVIPSARNTALIERDRTEPRRSRGLEMLVILNTCVPRDMCVKRCFSFVQDGGFGTCLVLACASPRHNCALLPSRRGLKYPLHSFVLAAHSDLLWHAVSSGLACARHLRSLECDSRTWRALHSCTLRIVCVHSRTRSRLAWSSVVAARGNFLVVDTACTLS